MAHPLMESMMKTNVMTVDVSLLLVMKNSTFALLTDCFAFAWLSSDIYATTQQKLGFFLTT
jgi:energy-converting hydrogenase Eha subunit E